MSLLTVGVGGSPITLSVSRAGHAEPRRVGKRFNAFYGNERSSIRAELMVVAVVLMNALPATIASVRSLFANAAPVSCSGDVFNNGGATVVCSGEITDEMEQGGTYVVTTLTLTEVGS